MELFTALVAVLLMGIYLNIKISTVRIITPSKIAKKAPRRWLSNRMNGRRKMSCKKRSAR
jgi:hypothetical protein